MPSNKNKALKDPIALKEKGNQAFISRDYPKAIDYFTKAIELDPTNPTLYSNRSAANLELDDYAMAIKDAEKAIQTDPKFFKGYIRKAQAMRESGDIDAAYKELCESSKLFSGNEDIQGVLGKLKLEYDENHKFASDHPEMKKFETFFKWLQEGGSNFDMLQLRFYTLNYRGIHARKKIKVFFNIERRYDIVYTKGKNYHT